MFIGHSELVKDFIGLAERKQLRQGYILFGEPEIGKFYFARHFAYFLETNEFKIGERPLQDALIIADANGIEAMRELKAFVWQKPTISKFRIAVINNADRLTPQAQNAILKIVEEPPEHTVIFLVTHQLDNLLPPLLSRLQKIYFSRLSETEMNAFTEDPKIRLSAYGRPGRALRLLSAEAQQNINHARTFLRLSHSARSPYIKELIEASKEQPSLLDYFFEALIVELRKDPIQNWRVLKSVIHRLFLIKSYNVNKRLQLEAIEL